MDVSANDGGITVMSEQYRRKEQDLRADLVRITHDRRAQRVEPHAWSDFHGSVVRLLLCATRVPHVLSQNCEEPISK